MGEVPRDGGVGSGGPDTSSTTPLALLVATSPCAKSLRTGRSFTFSVQPTSASERMCLRGSPAVVVPEKEMGFGLDSVCLVPSRIRSHQHSVAPSLRTQRAATAAKVELIIYTQRVRGCDEAKLTFPRCTCRLRRERRPGRIRPLFSSSGSRVAPLRSGRRRSRPRRPSRCGPMPALSGARNRLALSSCTSVSSSW